MIDYAPKEQGWAMVTINNGTAEIAFVASHLHDSRQDLVRSVVALEKYKEATVVFQDEPDGYVLHLECEDKHCHYTLHSFKGYDSVALCELVLEGNISLVSYKNDIAKIK